ncbi:hypothetical protein QBC35DRAFT_535614 [Podospora australis]|uniref:Uncharacterized protein n=1 Tax=Podospora australis TaxID=1536484 RepID=A0AAN6WNM8_9PEZI|nr:hypothetical protein QBC35DRAFT_535614 [Podospora australis]
MPSISSTLRFPRNVTHRLLPRAQELLKGLIKDLDKYIFDHDDCRTRVGWLMRNGTISPAKADEPGSKDNISTLIFARDRHGKLLFEFDEMTLTYPGCEAICGRVGYYLDKGPRVMVWVIPILLLLSNIELNPIDKHRFVSIVQSAGDPIDCTWSLMAKLHTRKKIYQLGHQYLASNLPEKAFAGKPWDVRRDKAIIIATVLCAYEDVFSAELQTGQGEEFFTRIMEGFGALDLKNKAVQRQWSKTALELVDSRTDERLRALLALAVYILGLSSAFVVDLGGTSQTIPGGVIASSLSLSFLVPIVILSNSIGGYTSRRTAVAILGRFVEGITAVRKAETKRKRRRRGRRRRRGGSGSTSTSSWASQSRGVNGAAAAAANHLQVDDESDGEEWEEYFRRLHWSGQVDTFRPWKTRRVFFDAREHGGMVARFKQWVLAFVAALPVTVGFIGAWFILLHAAEQGVSCRHLVLMGMYSAWILSVLASNATHYFLVKSARAAKMHWWMCVVKDVCIAIPALAFVFLCAAGYFNSCWCWSRAVIVGVEKASVFLPVNDFYRERLKTMFPGVVGGVVGFHLLYSAVLVLWYFRDAVAVLRWSEARRQRVWCDVHDKGKKKGGPRERGFYAQRLLPGI